jgi:hypothetical protein
MKLLRKCLYLLIAFAILFGGFLVLMKSTLDVETAAQMEEGTDLATWKYQTGLEFEPTSFKWVAKTLSKWSGDKMTIGVARFDQPPDQVTRCITPGREKLFDFALEGSNFKNTLLRGLHGTKSFPISEMCLSPDKAIKGVMYYWFPSENILFFKATTI